MPTERGLALSDDDWEQLEGEIPKLLERERERLESHLPPVGIDVPEDIKQQMVEARERMLADKAKWIERILDNWGGVGPTERLRFVREIDSAFLYRAAMSFEAADRELENELNSKFTSWFYKGLFLVYLGTFIRWWPFGVWDEWLLGGLFGGLGAWWFTNAGKRVHYSGIRHFFG